MGILKGAALVLPLLVGGMILWGPLPPSHPDPTVNGCVVVFLVIAAWWSIGLVPLYITALLVPVLATLLRVMRDPATGDILDAYAAAGLIVRSMFSSVTLVLLGAFTVAAAMRKYHVSHVLRVDALASWLLAKVGIAGLAGVLMIGCLLLSIVMPHEAVLVLALTAIDGILRRMEEVEVEEESFSENVSIDSANQPINHAPNESKMLILAVMVGCEIGGMMSPVSSPQNMLAYHEAAAYGIGWGRWLAVSIPVTHLAVIPSWALIVWIYSGRGRRRDNHVDNHVDNHDDNHVDNHEDYHEDNHEDYHVDNHVDNHEDKQDYNQNDQPIKCGKNPDDDQPVKCDNQSKADRQMAILATALLLLTILMWAMSPWLEAWLGSLGIISTIPFVLFFGTGLLDERDFEQIPWDVVLLSMGGVALAAAARSSGLYEVIGEEVRVVLADGSVSAFLLLKAAILGLTALALSTFKSHLVSALLLLPILGAIYGDASPPHLSPNPAAVVFPNGISEGALLYLLTTLACTTGMALPVSGLINMTVSSLASPRSRVRYLERIDFIAVGAPASIFATLSILAVGFPILRYAPI